MLVQGGATISLWPLQHLSPTEPVTPSQEIPAGAQEGPPPLQQEIVASAPLELQLPHLSQLMQVPLPSLLLSPLLLQLT